ncbi:MAG: HAD family hydrolase [Candidatus Rokubacteria bacterium]|nr:HAD family hydrolase [Candidatus Rokubacteria bacterium]MBI2524354.1 HAD family hydrolase [Candidatus Rokubacteria bacterium]
MRALLADLDDTILDYSGGAAASWEEACTGAAGPAGIDPGPLVAAVVATRRWFWGDPERHRRERVDMPGAWRKIAAHALESLGLPAHPLAAAIAEDFAARRRAALCLLPGALEALAQLRQRGVPLALVTNGDSSQQREKIERFDLARFFRVIVIEGEFGAGKPDEAVYRHALAALGAPARDSWMVGDNLEWDVAGPQRLGLRAAWVDGTGRGLPAGSPVRPDRVLRSFREVLQPG